MQIDADTLKGLIGQELKNLLDVRVTAHIQLCWLSPAELRDWDYGEPGEQYPCWITLADNGSNIAIAYCESGFGPRNPWGLLWLESREYVSMGMDSAWHSTFLDAYFNSLAATKLPIWRVFKKEATGVWEPVSHEDSGRQRGSLCQNARQELPQQTSPAITALFTSAKHREERYNL